MKIKKRAKERFANNIRFHTLTVVDAVENNQAYVNVVIDQWLQKHLFNDRDQNLLVEIVYGTLQHRYTLDYYLSPFIKGKKIEKWVTSLLRLTAYQLIYLDRIPAHAAIHEAVEIAKINGHRGLGNFVNAIFRQAQRQGWPQVEDIKNPLDYLSVKYSVDVWIIKLLQQALPVGQLEPMLASLLDRPYISARINAKPEDRQAIIDQLIEEGYQVQPGYLSPYAVQTKVGNVVNSSAFRQGKLIIQDESSMLVAPLGQIKGHEQVLDMCSAPGGKATHIAQLLTDGHLTALDISEEKLKRVNNHAKRMHLADKITTYATDARTFQPLEGPKLYDIIYIDAPCSGLGLMRRKPDIKYNKALSDIEALTQIQDEILDRASQLLKPGGCLVYSTCTVVRAENEERIQTFIERHPEFQLDAIDKTEVPEAILTAEGYVRVWPNQYHSDGFFISRLYKNEHL